MGGSSKWEVVLEMNALAGAQRDVLCEFELKQTGHKNPQCNAVSIWLCFRSNGPPVTLFSE